MRRLFIFASYDKDGIVDETLLYQLGELSKLGDIVFNMDNDITEYELDKVRAIPNVLYAGAVRHGEYDFGSYKRGYIWAKDILKNYDWVYLVNDSVYGPLHDLGPILKDLEARGTDVTGMYYVREPFYNGQPMPNHMNSWFVGLSGKVATSAKMLEFMNSIKGQPSKDLIVIKYEIGMSELFNQCGYSISSFMEGTDSQGCFDNPILTLRKGMPFLKKSPITMANISKAQAKNFINGEFIKKISNNMWRTGMGFGKYRKIWELRLFGLLPFVGVYKARIGTKTKVCLFRILTICSTHN